MLTNQQAAVPSYQITISLQSLDDNLIHLPVHVYQQALSVNKHSVVQTCKEHTQTIHVVTMSDLHGNGGHAELAELIVHTDNHTRYHQSVNTLHNTCNCCVFKVCVSRIQCTCDTTHLLHRATWGWTVSHLVTQSVSWSQALRLPQRGRDWVETDTPSCEGGGGVHVGREVWCGGGGYMVNKSWLNIISFMMTLQTYNYTCTLMFTLSTSQLELHITTLLLWLFPL